MTSLKTTGPVDLSKFDMSALIREANSNHDNFESVADEFATLKSHALGYALCAGAALAEVKARLKHGEWLPWLRQNFNGSEDTAQNYMRLYDRQGELPNTNPVRHFGVKEALKLLASPRPKSETKPRREPQPEPDDAPAEVVERRAAPISQEPVPPSGFPVDLAGAVQRHINDVVGRWPKGHSYHMLLGVLSQSYTRVKALEVKFNGGEQ
jgi:hypothetical protein